MIRHAYELIDRWVSERARHASMVVAVDFDGTLSPIVPQPSDAVILTHARDALRALALRPDTRVAVVSGRGISDVRGRVGLDAVIYAGNHGLEIEGPGIHRIHADAVSARPALTICVSALEPLVRAVPGVIVEDKGLSLSVHYRLVPEERVADVVEEVRRRCGREPTLELTFGKKVIEIRPRVDWNKGKATEFLIEQLLPAGPVLFIGDDRTDEDAFRAIAGRGDGVVVGDPPPADTAATSYVRTPHEVAELLGRLADR